MKRFFVLIFILCLFLFISACTTEKHTISYESNGGTLVDNATYTKNSLVTKPINPSKPGYLFGGWYENEELTTEYAFYRSLKEDLTLYAKWYKFPKIEIINVLKSNDLIKFNLSVSDEDISIDTLRILLVGDEDLKKEIILNREEFHKVITINELKPNVGYALFIIANYKEEIDSSSQIVDQLHFSLD